MRRINLGLVVIGAVVALAGCGGGGEEPPAGQAVAQTEPTQQSEREAQSVAEPQIDDAGVQTTTDAEGSGDPDSADDAGEDRGADEAADGAGGAGAGTASSEPILGADEAPGNEVDVAGLVVVA